MFTMRVNAVIRAVVAASCFTVVTAMSALGETKGATNDDAAVISALSGGGRVTEVYDGYIAQLPDGGSTRWTRAFDGYFASINGESVRITRSYDGFIVRGGYAERVSRTHDGFIVYGRGSGLGRWSRVSDGYSGSVDGRYVRLSRTHDGLLSYLAPTNQPLYTHQPARKKVRRMSQSKPSAFRRWPPVEDVR
jgi:hypothetical protein